MPQEVIEHAIARIVEFALDPTTIGAAFGLYFLLRYISRALETTRHTRLIQIWRRALPIMPELIAVPVSVFGGLPVVSGKSILFRVAMGLWVAYISEKAKKILGQTILGDDKLLEKLLSGKKGEENSHEKR